MKPFDLTAEEAQVAATARAFLAGFVDNSYLNEQEESELGYEPGRWSQMADLGWTAMALPERVGGAGGTLVDAALIVRECGRAAFASPLLQTLRVGTVLTSEGFGATYDDVLSRLAEGSTATLVAPPDGGLLAEATADAQRLSGEPVLVEWLVQSQDVVLLVPDADDRWLCAVVPSADLAQRVTEVPSVDNERIALLDVDGLVLEAAAVRDTGLSARVVRRALARADLLRDSTMVGGCMDVLERTAKYALERHQFGQPIGGFQAVRQLLSRMVIATDGAHLLCDEALTASQADADATAIASAAVFAAGRAYVEVVLTGAQVHGGVGTTIEHVLHHHFRRAKAMQLRSGRRANRLREIHEALVVKGEGSLW